MQGLLAAASAVKKDTLSKEAYGEALSWLGKPEFLYFNLKLSFDQELRRHQCRFSTLVAWHAFESWKDGLEFEHWKYPGEF
jgi:hypothetical protein